MKSLSVFSSSILALSLSLAAPTLAHVGHGDEFQATGGVNRVEVKADTDALLGILVEPIEPAADGGDAVLIPVSALVDDNGRQLVFVQYENFYEPVDVVSGTTQGELIEVTEGLSVGEQLVTQGSLSLYAESRKTQTSDAAANAEAVEAPQTDETAISTEKTTSLQTNEAHNQAHAEGIPHSHEQSIFSLKTLLTGGAGLAIVGGVIAFVMSNRNKKADFSN